MKLFQTLGYRIIPQKNVNNELNFNFLTNQGIYYYAGFLDFSDNEAVSDIGKHLQYCTVSPVEGQGPAPRKDDLIGATLADLVNSLTAHDPDAIVTFTCIESDRRGMARLRRFGGYYNTHNIGNRYTKIEFKNESTGEYGAFIFLAENRFHARIQELAANPKILFG